jgi:hypothetical protein
VSRAAAGVVRLGASTTVSALAALIALAGVYFWPLLRPGAGRSLGGDFAAQTVPWRRYVTAELFAGRLPHWAPKVGLGFPLLADIETNVFYPVALLVSLLAGPEPSYRTLEVQSALHHVVAGAGMYLLLARVGAGAVGAFGGAALFAFSGFFWAHGAHLTVVQSASWGPWVLLGGVALLERPGARAAASLACALALAILGGHPQLPYYIVLALGVTLGLGWWLGPREGAPRPPARRLTGLGLLACVLAAGLTAVQLLPTAVLTRESVRWKVPATFLAEGTLPVPHLLTFLVPLAYHRTPQWGNVDEFHGYVGILALVMAAWALCRPWRRWTAVFAALAGLGLVIALSPPLASLGGAGLFRIPARALYLVDLGLTGLAGLGLDDLLRAARPWPARMRRFRVGLGLAAGVAVLAAAWLALTGLPPWLEGLLSPELPTHVRALAGLLVGAALVVEVVARLPLGHRLAQGVVVAIVVIEVLAFPRAMGWAGIPPDAHWVPRADLEALARAAGPYRVLGDRMFSRPPHVEANLGLVYGLPLPSVYSSLRLRRQGRFQDVLIEGAVRSGNVYDLLGVRWIVSPRDLRLWTVEPRQPEAPGLESDWPSSRLTRVRPGVWEVSRPLPRAYLPERVRVIRGKEGVLEAVRVTDPRRTVVLERNPEHCPSRSPAAGDEVQFVVDEPDRIRLRVRSAERGPLVLADSYYPGWRATVDGKPVPIVVANYLFRAVCVPAGEHEVVFSFRQPGLYPGLALTVLSGVAVALGLVGRWPRGAQEVGRPPNSSIRRRSNQIPAVPR